MAITVGVIVTYLGVLVGIGWLFHGASDASEYFRSGCKASWWLVGTSIFMAGITARTFTGNAGAAFEAGWSVLQIYAAGMVAALVQAAFLAHRFRQTRAITFPEILRERFGVRTQLLYVGVTLVLGSLLAGVWLWGCRSSCRRCLELRRRPS
ncbi:MAG: hypothetical protein AAF797_03840 [Planctomycetota bacterium]